MDTSIKDAPGNIDQLERSDTSASNGNISKRRRQARRSRGSAEISSPSLDDLIDAYNEEDNEESRPRFETLRKAFERSHGAKIEEQYFTVLTNAAVVLLREDSRTLKTKFSYDSGIATPNFDEVMRALHSEQLLSSILLGDRTQDIVVRRIYAIIANLLNVLDSCQSRQGPFVDSDKATRLNVAVNSGRKELDSIREFVLQATRRQALVRYLAGFPAGIIVAVLAVVAVLAMPFTIGQNIGNGSLAVCLGAGAIGAVISVMARITRGQKLDIDSDQGRTITALAGAFRPIVGAVFGAMLYALIIGGILPLELPPKVGSGQADIGLFFASIAFLAGFSERWAQDTIVQSTPGVKASKKPGQPKNEELSHQ